MVHYKLNYSCKRNTSNTQPLTKDLFYRVAGSVEVTRIITQLKGKEKGTAEYDNLKEGLPMYFPHAVYVDGKRPKAERNNIKPSGLCMHDFDKMPVDVRQFFEEKVKPLIGKELDLVLAHISCGGHGLRLVDRLPEGETLAQHQRKVALMLGVKESQDEQIKDYPRASFFPNMDYILFIDDDRFFDIQLPGYEEGNLFGEQETQSETPLETPETTPAPYYNTGVCVEPKVEGAFSVVPSYQGVPLNLVVDHIVKTYCTGGKLTEDGHQRDNLCFHAALCLRPLVDSNWDVIYGLLAQPLKDVGFSDAEIRKTITSALARQSGYIKTPNPEVTYILNKLKAEMASQLAEPVLPKAPKMPKIMEDVARLFPAWLHDTVILAQLPIWGFMADNAMIMYRGNRWKRLQFSTHIIGGAAAGKSFIVVLRELLMQKFLAEDAEVLAKEEADRQNRKRKEKQQGEDVIYRSYKKHFMEANITRPQAYARLNAADGHMMMLFTEEVGEFDASMRSQSDGFKHVLLKSFDYGEVTKSTMSDDSPNISCQVSLNSLTAGTPVSTASHLGNNSDGLLSRNIVVLMPNRMGVKGDWDDDVREPSAKLKATIDKTVEQLGTIGNGDYVKMKFPVFLNAFKEWFDGEGGVNDQYQDNGDSDWLVLARRAAEIGYRAMVLFWLLNGCPKGINNTKGNHSKKIQEIIEAGLWVAEYVRTTQYSVVKSNAVKPVACDIQVRTGKNKRVLSALPDEFTTLDYINMKQSQGDCVSTASIYKTFERLVADGSIEKMGKDRWKKVKQAVATA